MSTVLDSADVERRRSELAPFDGWNERAMLSLFALTSAQWGIPKTHLDLGSGTGALVNMARKMGVASYGADLIAESPGREHWFFTVDLAEPLFLVYPNSEGKVFAMQDEVSARRLLRDDTHAQVGFELITCLEVAEHLPEYAADTLCDTIARHLGDQGKLIFSAAPPGQKGVDHVNCQHSTYWRSKFYERKISYREDYTRQLAHLWAWIAGPLNWLGGNVMVFDA